MEDVFSVAYQQTEDEMDLEYAFFGIFDGHGGKEAAIFAKEHLMDNITKQQNFWSDDDDLVLKAIREGFLMTQQAMWADLENWTKTATGLPSTAGTTASIAFIRRGKIFVGHVGDSGIVLGGQDENNIWRPKRLTRDHKPECEKELARIEAAGGKVVNKSGVPRVVWNRPRVGHQGPVRRSTPIDEIPFLAVARALGDLWSYNSKRDVFVVSPEPDLHVYNIDINTNRCLLLGTDGCWNVLSPEIAVSAVQQAEKNNEKHMIDPQGGHTWINPSKKLVDMGVDRWKACKLRADNTSVVVVMLDPPGPPRAQVLRKQRDMAKVASLPVKKPCNNDNAPPLPPKPKPKPSKGLAIISRFPNSKKSEEKMGKNLVKQQLEEKAAEKTVDKSSTRIVHDSMKTEPQKVRVDAPHSPAESATVQSSQPCPDQDNQDSQPSSSVSVPSGPADAIGPAAAPDKIQCNEVTSSDDEGEGSSSSYATKVPTIGDNRDNRGRKSLSRELSALQLDSPLFGTSKTRRDKRRTRRSGVTATGEESDIENREDKAETMVPVSKLVEMEKKCAALNDKLKLMEKKVADKTDAISHEVRMLKSSLAETNTESLTAVTPRVLRSRNGGDHPTPASGTKRKRAVEAVVPTKRERTVTCPGNVAGSRQAPARQTRRSEGATPGRSKLRRSKMSLLKK